MSFESPNLNLILNLPNLFRVVIEKDAKHPGFLMKSENKSLAYGETFV